MTTPNSARLESSRSAKRVFLQCFEVCVLVAALLVSISTWVTSQRLTPDSTNYAVAAQNLIQHGELFVYANWPSRSLEPVVEPYTEHLPGFPLYLSVFLILFRAPMSSIVIAQSAAIVGFYLGMAWVMHLLRLQLVFRTAGYVFLAVFATFRLTFLFFWSEALFTALSLAAGGCALLLLDCDHGTKAYWKRWVCGLCFLAMASSIKVVGIFNIAWFVLPLLRHGGRRLALASCTLVAGVGPIALWLARNKLVYGATTISHEIGQTLFWDRLWTPVLFLTRRALSLDLLSWGALVVALVLLLLVAAIASRGAEGPMRLLSRALGRVERLLSRPGGRDASYHLTLVGTFASHFFGIWILSLIIRIDPLDDRLLFPSIAIGLIATLNGLAVVCGKLEWTGARTLCAISPFLFLLMANYVAWPTLQATTWRVKTPREGMLWQKIDALGLAKDASHFYSHHDFKHQIFAGIPQRILWDIRDISSSDSIARLAEVGNNALFVFSKRSRELAVFKRNSSSLRVELHEYSFAELGFVVYSQSESDLPP